MIAPTLPSTNKGWNLKDSIARSSGDLSRFKAVVVGGGTGAPVSIKTLLGMGVQTSAVVAMADDGGSTGLIREYADAIPPGDIRKCLAAMALDSDAPMTQAFEYRFNYADDHALGNLMITALAKISSFPEAIEICQRILDTQGNVYPSTLDSIVLNARTLDGRTIVGQAAIGHSSTAIEKVWIDSSDPTPYGPALDALREADLVVLGPGSLFTSIIPNILVPGICDAIRESGATTIFLCSLADMQGETWGLDCAEHVQALLDHGMEGLVDIVCVSSTCDERYGLSVDREIVPANEKLADSPDAPASAPIRRPLLNDEIRARIQAMGPQLVEANLVDTVLPTWHSPAALEAIFAEALQRRV
ncbi:MAG: YvcK family protein [bacterium]|nr:YvcK family protein [bacterium]